MHPSKTDLLQKATHFLQQYFVENGKQGFNQRLHQVNAEISNDGTYLLTEEELTYGAKLAWRNSNRCIGRLFWKSLKVRDRRSLSSPEEIFADLMEHLDFATNAGKIRSAISIYQAADRYPRVRILNKQLVRFAGYLLPNGQVLGDPDSLQFTRFCHALGWESVGTAFDLLPVVIQVEGEAPKWFTIPEEKVLRVPIIHPEYPWLERMNIQWYAVPVISDMRLEMGGISFTCAPFNGWYMLTEIAVRNLADAHRYNLLPQLAEKMGLDTRHVRTLWKDKALLVLQEAVLHSFQEKGITLVDHHSASEQFLEFCRVEEAKGRKVQADWSWIVPPTAGSTLGVFHREWENQVLSPNFFYQEVPRQVLFENEENLKECPFHHG
ncbi:nitric oxide synthase oxygenase [Algoriphagus sp. AK58]|uniref:nitric oxide synthase oxygenase n=1 Tax=Algoriphagus sp. AK58 TaxID=1406877 RepID=UPI00164F9A29|nr:nitric oxide synthase oxygenase [Algoriphagus sp. AK58]MBC6365604.1 nitric oxide synthase [Algoriphagus sp. AK58]